MSAASGFLQQISIHMVGRPGEPGSVEFTLDGLFVEKAWRPEAEFAIILELSAAAHGARDGSIEAYLPSKQLAKRLWKRNLLERADPQLVVRTVYRLRQRLGRLSIVELLSDGGFIASPAEFGKVLIERSPLLGYRLAVGPENLMLTVTEQPTTCLVGKSGVLVSGDVESISSLG